MIKTKYWKAVPMVGCLVMLAGCSQAMTDSFFAESVTDSRKFHKVTQEAVKDNYESLSEQHKKMHPEAAADIDKLKAEYAAKFEKLQERNDNIHSAVGEVVRELASRFANLAPGGSVASYVAGVVVTASDKAEAKTDKVATDAKDARTTMKTDAEKARTAMLASFTTVRADTFAKLDSLKEDRAAFEQTLRDEVKLTPEQLENLNGMTTEQIMAMIAAAVGAAGAGGVLAKTGKSRSHGAIDKINERLDTITTDAALEKPSPSADRIVSHGTPQPKASS